MEIIRYVYAFYDMLWLLDFNLLLFNKKELLSETVSKRKSQKKIYICYKKVVVKRWNIE